MPPLIKKQWKYVNTFESAKLTARKVLELQISVVSVCKHCGRRCGWYPRHLDERELVRLPLWKYCDRLDIFWTRSHCNQMKLLNVPDAVFINNIWQMNQRYVDNNQTMTLSLNDEMVVCFCRIKYSHPDNVPRECCTKGSLSWGL